MCERTETMAIETVHLRLEPYAPERLLALIEGDERFGERFGLPERRGGPHRLDHLAAFLRWTPQFLLPPVREILRGGEPEGKVPLRMFFQASVHLLRRRPSVRRVRSLAVV